MLLLLLIFILAGFFAGVTYILYRKLKLETSELNNVLAASSRINRVLLDDLDFETVIQKIADIIPQELKFGTGVISILNEEKQVIQRVAASRTREAIEAIKALSVPFGKIEISLRDTNNLMAIALRENKPLTTEDVYDVLGPILSRDEAKKIQQIMGTKTTLVYPIFLKNKPIGVFVASTKKKYNDLSKYELYIINNFVNLVGIVLQNSKLYTRLKETKENLASVNKEVSIMNSKLKELDKLKDDFVSIASHELRTPMTAIRSYAWMALYKSDIPISEKMKKYLQRTLISTERLINLVNDMLNVSRIESGSIEINPEVFDVQNLVGEVLVEIDAKAKEKNLHLINTPGVIPRVYADSNKIHQVLLNLVGNALKFTPAEGKITVSYFADGVNLDISISDTGVGIDKEDISMLFKKFSRLDNSYVAASTTGGTGLGLFICKSLIEKMGGRIWAQSNGVNKGSVFTFSLPIATKEIQEKASKFVNKSLKGAKLLEPVAVQA